MKFKVMVGIMGLLAIISASAHAAVKIKPKPADTSEYDSTLEKRYHDRMGPGKFKGKPTTGTSEAGQAHKRPVLRTGPCDSHMGGCNDQQ